MTDPGGGERANGAAPPAGDEPRDSAQAQDERTFNARGTSWIARLAGEGLGGTGHLGTARFSILYFFAPGESRPRFQALVAAGRLQHLFERELAELLERAQPVIPPER